MYRLGRSPVLFESLRSAVLVRAEILADLAELCFVPDINAAEISALHAALAYMHSERLLNRETRLRAYSDSRFLTDVLTGRASAAGGRVQEVLEAFCAMLDQVRRETGFVFKKNAVLVHVPGTAVKKSVLGH